MIFRTKLKLPPAEIKIDHNDPIILMGSCFSTHIGQKLTRYKFDTLVNPYGTLFHPLPLCNSVKNALLDIRPSKKEIVAHSDMYFHYSYHSDIRADNRKSLESLIGDTNEKVRKSLSNASCLIVTLGTAFYFYHIDNQSVVANCHKVPARQFERNLSSVSEITQTLSDLMDHLHAHNSQLQIIFTVSPVRHIRDGLIANARSKAHLLGAVHAIVDTYELVSYFPAYEILVDDLRDYRYYERDLLHPSVQAIDYIWAYFEESYLQDTAKLINKQLDHFLSAATHRPFNPASSAHQLFLKKTIKELAEFAKAYGINMDIELASLTSQLTPI